MLPSTETSLWIATTPDTDYPKYSGDAEFDAVVIGGGITGIMTAWRLQDEGLDTALIEKDRIIKNTTGNTTAKLTSQHYLVYQQLVRDHGEETAKIYARANEDAIDNIEELIRQEAIDCDFRRTAAYVYTQKSEQVETIEREVEVTRRLGLKSSFETNIGLPFEVKGAIKFPDQAEFHPRKFLLPIAERFVAAGGRIFERTQAKEIIPGSGMQTVVTDGGKIKSKFVVEATKYPFWRPKLFEKAYWTKLSYALGAIIKDNYPEGMYITTDEPIRTIRTHPYQSDKILIFGGESHEMKEGYDKNEHYRNLEDDLQTKFKVQKIAYKWIAGDAMSRDNMPIIGQYPNSPGVFISFGYRAWGLAWAVAASKLLHGHVISGRPLDWGRPFSPQRLEL